MEKKLYLTHNESRIKADGTFFIGNIHISYDDLVKKFGEPLEGDGYKVDSEWILYFPDDVNGGRVITIYNWKNGKSYMGDKGQETKDITKWNVGGINPKDISLLLNIINS